MSVVTFSYALLEVKSRKYSSLVMPKNYPETTYVHILPGVGGENIFENIFKKFFSGNIFKNIFSENIFFENIFSSTLWME